MLRTPYSRAIGLESYPALTKADLVSTYTKSCHSLLRCKMILLNVGVSLASWQPSKSWTSVGAIDNDVALHGKLTDSNAAL